MKKLLTIALAASLTLALSVNSFALGNYVVAQPAEEDEDEVLNLLDDEIIETVPDEVETVKPNPDTGTNDFVGAATAAAVIAGIGFAVLKKR